MPERRWGNGHPQFKTVIYIFYNILWVQSSKVFVYDVPFLLFTAHILPGVLLLTETLVGCDVSWAIVLITMSLGMNGASTLTNLQNSQDLSPNYAPTIYGIINSIGSITGIINPLIVGYITADHVSIN